MMIKLQNVFFIIIASSIIGLVINFIRPNSLLLIKESKNLTWADSLSISNKAVNNSVQSKNELSKNKKINYKKDTINYQKKENKAVISLKNNSNDTENSKDKVEGESFKEPVAINLEQAYKLSNKNITFIDAREYEDYKAGHIKNALSLPYYDFEAHKNVLNKISKNNFFVIYCAGTDCDLSILLGNKLFKMGYNKVYIFFGGWNDWLNEKYPVESTKN